MYMDSKIQPGEWYFPTSEKDFTEEVKVKILFWSRMVLSFNLDKIPARRECFRRPPRPRKKAKNKNTKKRQEMNFPGKKLP